MIQKINKIKNLGLVFTNYTPDSALPEFKKFNLIYGWNGCGKTTFTKLFDCVQSGYAGSVEYEVECSEGNRYSHLDNFPYTIRIFNQSYIEKNIKILEGHANSISIILGEENQDLLKVIKADQTLLSGDPENKGKLALRTDLRKEIGKKSKERDDQFTNIARTIGAAFVGSASRSYRKPQAQSDFDSLTAKSELNQTTLGAIAESCVWGCLPSSLALQLRC